MAEASSICMLSSVRMVTMLCVQTRVTYLSSKDQATDGTNPGNAVTTISILLYSCPYESHLNHSFVRPTLAKQIDIFNYKY